MPEEIDFTELFKNIEQGLKVYSVQELNDALKCELRKREDKLEKTYFVLDEVCALYGITRRTLQYSQKRGLIKEARKLAACVLHYNLGLGQRHIAIRIFSQKYHNSISTSLREFKGLNDQFKADREFKEKYEGIQRKLLLFLKKDVSDGTK